jgi:hypothetical protein
MPITYFRGAATTSWSVHYVQGLELTYGFIYFTLLLYFVDETMSSIQRWKTKTNEDE